MTKLQLKRVHDPCLIQGQLCRIWHRVVNGHHFEARARYHKPDPGPSPAFIFEARFWPESQIYRVSQDKPNCEVPSNVVYWYSCKCTALSHLDQNIGKHQRSLLVNNNIVECNVYEEKMKLSRNYCIHDGAIGIKETIWCSATGMKSLFIGHRFLK